MVLPIIPSRVWVQQVDTSECDLTLTTRMISVMDRSKQIANCNQQHLQRMSLCQLLKLAKVSVSNKPKTS